MNGLYSTNTTFIEKIIKLLYFIRQNEDNLNNEHS